MKWPSDSLFVAHNDLFKSIGQIADKAGIEAYVIGGFVRDTILYRPSKDIDIVVLGSGIEFAKQVASAFKNVKLSYFEHFGTAQIIYQDWILEFVGARKESYRQDSRNPIVESGTLRDDQERRDLTINAMSIGLNQANFGQLIDPFNGLDDIDKQLVRTPLDPDKTFSDDPLRMLRAIRFASQLGFRIDAITLELLSFLKSVLLMSSTKLFYRQCHQLASSICLTQAC